MATSIKKAAILLAFGAPDSIEDVGPFIKNVLKNRPLTDDFLQKTIERYRLIGGSSPLLNITRAQAKAMEDALARAGDPYRVYVGMRYWNPFIKDTLSQMKADGFKEAVAVIMSPFTSHVATGGYLVDVEEAQKAIDPSFRVKYVPNWHLNRQFIECIADNIKEAEKAFEKKEDALVIFSNHSLPMAALEGDAYEMKIHQTIEEIIKLAPVSYKAAYQSQGRLGAWLGPKTDEVIAGVKKSGKKGVIVVPLGFAADHVETLYDIDIFFKGLAASSGLIFKRTPSLNAHPRIIEMLCELVRTQGDRSL